MLHTAIYQRTGTTCIIHVHSPHSLLIAELFSQRDEFVFTGFEVQKGLGFSDMSQCCQVPIFENKTSLKSLSQDISTRIQPGQIGFLIGEHGLFAWGRTVAEAKRHVELLHHIFECELLKRKFQEGR